MSSASIALVIGSMTGLVGAAAGAWAVWLQPREARRRRRWEHGRGAIEAKRSTATHFVAASSDAQWASERVGGAMRHTRAAREAGDDKAAEWLRQMRDEQARAMFQAQTRFEDAVAALVMAWHADQELMELTDSIRERISTLGLVTTSREDASAANKEIGTHRGAIVRYMLERIAEDEAELDGL